MRDTGRYILYGFLWLVMASLITLCWWPLKGACALLGTRIGYRTSLVDLWEAITGPAT